MMTHNKLQITLLILMLGMVSYYCESEKTASRSDTKIGVVTEVAGSGSGTVSENSGTADVLAENQGGSIDEASLIGPCIDSVYPLVREKTCVSCHGAGVSTQFATDDAEESCRVLYNEQKVNLSAPDKSALFVRLYDLGHNCWTADCAADAQEMLVQIDAWATEVQEAVQESLANVVKSNELRIVDAIEDDAAPEADPGVIAFEAEASTRAGNFILLDNANASGNQALYVAENNAAGCNNNNADPANEAVINFTVPEAGNNFLFGSMAAAAYNSDSIFFSIDDEPFLVWRPAQTADNETFQWGRATQSNNVNDLLPAVNLTAGDHTLRFRCRESETRVDAVAFSLDANFNGTDVVTTDPDQVLSFDMTEQCQGVPATLKIGVIDYGEESYRFSRPILEAASAVNVKGLNIFINGFTDSKYATFTLVDKTVEANSTDPLLNAAMIVLKDKGPEEDLFAFSLDMCAPAN